MSLFKEQTPAQIIATQACDNCLEEHSDEFHSCKSSYSAQHPMLAARLAVKSIRKRDHLENYQEVNPFARAEPRPEPRVRAEPRVTDDDIVRATVKLNSLKIAKRMQDEAEQIKIANPTPAEPSPATPDSKSDELVKAALALMKIPGRTGLCMRPVQGTKSRHRSRHEDPLRRCKGSKVFGGSDASFLAMWPSGTMIDDVDLSKDHFWESYSERSHNWGVSHVSAFYFYIMCERMVEGRLTEKDIWFMFSP